MSMGQRETDGEPDRMAAPVTCCEVCPASNCPACTPRTGRSASHMTPAFRCGTRCRNWCDRSFNLVHLNTGQLLCTEPRWKLKGADCWSAVGQRAVRLRRRWPLPSKARASFPTNGRFLTATGVCTPFRSPSAYATGCSSIYLVCVLTSGHRNVHGSVSRVRHVARFLFSRDDRPRSAPRSSHSWTGPSHWRAGCRSVRRRWERSMDRRMIPAARRR